MSTITKEQAKDLRNAFQFWQQDYDPVEDKEQYDMFGLGMVAMDALLASLEPVSVFKIDHESSLIKHVKKVVSETNAPPAPVSVPDEATSDNIQMLASTYAPRGVTYQWDSDECNAAADSWNACRAAMLQGADQPQNAPQNIPEKIPARWRQWIIDVVEYLENGLEVDGELEAQGSVDAKRLLASLEAEAVALRDERSGSGGISKKPGFNDLPHGTPLYAAPPAPEIYHVGDATMRHIFTPTGITDVSDMQPVFDQIETVLAGMWQPAPVSVPDFDTLRLLFEASERESDHGFNLHKYGIGYADEATQARWEAWVACRAAMLQGVENGESATTMKTAPALDSSPKIDESPSGNSPVIPDGWVMVPVEPTYQMCKAMGLPWESPRFPDLYKAMLAVVKK